MNRRNFLRGASAVAVAAALPAPVLADGPVTAKLLVEHRPIFQGAIGTYQGVVLRSMNMETYDLNAYARQTLKSWFKGVDAAGPPPAGGLAYGVVTSTVLEGVDADGC